MNYKQWIVAQSDKELAATIAEDYNLDPLEALLLVSRGITSQQQIEDFYSESAELSNPFDILDMDKAAQRVAAAIDNFERIAVYGDYDADGVTATAVLYSYLQMKGADVVYRIPDRESDGYGLHDGVVDELHDMGVKVIVTVDNGISAIDQAERCKQLGIDLVVTDHHVAGDELPDCVAVVDPHRPDCESEFKDFAGVGVAFKLICAVEGDDEELFNEFADLVAIGTIADIVSLLGENRSIVKRGLELINNSSRAGIRALKKVAGYDGKKMTSTAVAFGIAPRINAAGRMGSAERALKLLITDDEQEAMQIAQELNLENAHRQELEQSIMKQIEQIIARQPSLKYDRVMVVSGEGWQSGVVGIVASRLVERYGRPAIVITECADGEAKGSGRSVQGFSLYDALHASSEVLDRFGGHTLAAGLGLKRENIDKFRKIINEYAKGVEMPFPSLNLDCKLNPAYVNTDTLKILERLEPFGQGNKQPLFGLYGMTLNEIVPVSNGKHLRLVFSKGGNSVSVMKFGVGVEQFPFLPGDRLDLAVTLSPNEYRGSLQVSVFLREIKMSDEDEALCLESSRLFEKYKRSEHMSSAEAENAIPERDVFAKVYRFIRKNGGWKHSVKMLCSRIHDSVCTPCKVGVSLDAMQELGLIERANGFISLPDEVIQVNLDDSNILKTLKAQRGD